MESGGWDLVTLSTVNKNEGNGIALENGDSDNAIALTTVNGNKSAGLSISCPSNVYGLTALNNGQMNLSEPSPKGCVNVKNDAP